MLLLLAVPGHLAFIVAICAAESLGVPSPLFVLLYLLAAVMQVPSQLVTSWSHHSAVTAVSGHKSPVPCQIIGVPRLTPCW